MKTLDQHHLKGQHISLSFPDSITKLFSAQRHYNRNWSSSIELDGVGARRSLHYKYCTLMEGLFVHWPNDLGPINFCVHFLD